MASYDNRSTSFYPLYPRKITACCGFYVVAISLDLFNPEDGANVTEIMTTTDKSFVSLWLPISILAFKALNRSIRMIQQAILWIKLSHYTLFSTE